MAYNRNILCKRALLRGAISGIVLAAAFPALARDGQSAPDPAQTDTALADIVVTARQRSENIQNTPLSIAAVDARTMDRMQARTIVDLDAKVPSLQFGTTSVRLQTYTGIRGVGDYSRNPGYDNRAGIYLDGVLMGRSAATDYPVFDIAQVEVLRGPQGTLFGKDALTGVINITSVKPKFKDEMQLRLSAGSRELLSGSAVVNTALSDQVAIRLSLTGRGQNGYYLNRLDGSTAGGGTTFGARGQLRWVPSEQTTVDLSIDGVRDVTDTLLGGTPLTGPGAAFTDGGRNFSQNQKPRKTRKIYGGGLNIEQKLGDYTLTSITGYRTSTNRFLNNDLDLSPLEQGHNSFNDESSAFSQEVRLASPGSSPFNYVVGLFYYNQVASSDWTTSTGPDFPVALQLRDISRVSTQVFAGFGHATWKATPWLTLDGGVRVNHTRKAIRYQQITNGFLGYINIPNYTDSLTQDDASPLASITLLPTDRIRFYATYSTGQRAGGWNADLTKFTNLAFGPERGRNFEAGIKTDLFDRRLRLNISAYLMKFTNFQVTQLGIRPGHRHSPVEAHECGPGNQQGHRIRLRCGAFPRPQPDGRCSLQSRDL